MSAAGGAGKEDVPEKHTGFECAEQVAALLNCVADRSYNEMKCLPLLRKLRTCVEKKVVYSSALAWCRCSLRQIESG